MLSGCDRSGDESPQETKAEASEAAKPGEIDRSHAGDLMPAANLVDPDGNVLNLGALQGRPVLLNLWATWCAPCVKEMPLLDQLARDYEGRLKVLTISQDLTGTEAVGPFFARNRFTHLESWIDPQNHVGEDIGGGVMPTTVLYVGSEEVWRVQGDYDWSSEKARAAIDAAIAE